MKEFRFRTTINCQNCIRSVSGFLNDVQGIASWSVDTNDPDKILVVESDEDIEKDIIEAVEDAGFDITSVS